MIVDGVLINGCLMLAPEMDGKHFETVEGLPMRRATFLPSSSPLLTTLPCSAATALPASSVSATALLLRKTPIPPVMRSSILSGNLCRCTGYKRNYRGVDDAADRDGGAK